MTFKRLILLLILPVLSQCTDDGLSSKIDFTIIPDDPLVINADSSIPQEGDQAPIPIKGPWFKVGFTITNGSTEDFVLKLVKVSYLDAKNRVLGEGVMDPGSFDNDTNNDGTPDYDIGSSLFKVVPKISGTTVGTYVLPISWYLHGLPTLPKSSTVYKLKIEPIGWFGTENEPTSRFSRAFFFVTQ